IRDRTVTGVQTCALPISLPDGRRICQSTRTEDRKEAEALVAKLKSEAFREAAFGIKPKRSWQQAVVRYLEVKASLRSVRDVRRKIGRASCRERVESSAVA